MFNCAIANQFNNRFERNSKQKIIVKCDVTDCPFYICARVSKNTQMMSLKEFKG